jgi:hypothetical protein
MVENTGKEDKSTKNYRIKVESLENDLYRLELEEFWDKTNDWGKIRSVLANAEDEILEWHKTSFSEKRASSLTFQSWKEKLFETFTHKADIDQFLGCTQEGKESADAFLRRVSSLGRKLNVRDEISLGVFKKGLCRSQDYIKLAIIGVSTISTEIYKKIREAEQISEENFKRSQKKKKNSKQKNVFNQKEKGSVNIISESDILNKENSIYICNKKVSCLIDTGADDCYITRNVLKQVRIKPNELKQPIERRTCLNEKFVITQFANVRFSVKNKKCEEKFYILPKRDDELVILGKNWLIKNAKKHKPEAEESLEMLIEELCTPKRSIEDYVCRINTIPGKIVVMKPYKIEQALESKVDAEVARLLKKGYITHSTSSWLNKVKPVVKPNGTLRLTANFVPLNNLVLLDKYSLPDILEMLYKLKGKLYRTKIDLKDGFYQIPLHPDDRHKTAFRIKNRLYEYTKMPMGFKNSPAIFQRYMDRILGDEIGKSCFVYVDDILIFGETEKEHDDNLKRVIKLLLKGGLVANKEKIEFRKTDIVFLGHKLVGDKIVSEVDNGQAIRDLVELRNVDEVRSFIGTVNYYRMFIDKCASKTEPLSRLLKKKQKFVWEKEQKVAFQTLKEELLGERILFQPDYSKEFFLESDASNKGIGVILSQEVNGAKMPIMYASRTLSETEQNYSISEKEMLAALWGMEKFQYFLKGREFTLITDHIALKALTEKGEIKSARISRWIERIQEFNFNVEYKPGKAIPHVDGLSRLASSEICNISIESTNNDIKENVLKLHEKLVHRGSKITTEEYNKINTDKVTLEEVRKILENCMTCKIYNPVRVGKPRYIGAYAMGDKVAFDIIGPFNDKYIIAGIDYFTRYAFASVIPNRETKHIVKFIQTIHDVIPIKTLISDSAKENTSKDLIQWCDEKGIAHHFTTPHHHQSNGRIERFNRTLLEAINKQPPSRLLKHKVRKAIEIYNTVTHSRTGFSPDAARNPENWLTIKQKIYKDLTKANSERGKGLKTKTYSLNDTVLIKSEIHKLKGQPKFGDVGIITEILGFDTYRIRMENGRFLKRHADQLRAGEETLSELGPECCGNS